MKISFKSGIHPKAVLFSANKSHLAERYSMKKITFPEPVEFCKFGAKLY
jgi:hypothetical protein